MVDPASYITTKIVSAVGGLVGGFTMMSYIKPKTINEAFTRGAVSCGSAIIFAVPIMQMFTASENWQMQLMFGALVGFVSYSVLGATARFFEKTQENDIVEIVDKVRGKNAGKDRKSLK